MAENAIIGSAVTIVSIVISVGAYGTYLLYKYGEPESENGGDISTTSINYTKDNDPHPYLRDKIFEFYISLIIVLLLCSIIALMWGIGEATTSVVTLLR